MQVATLPKYSEGFIRILKEKLMMYLELNKSIQPAIFFGNH